MENINTLRQRVEDLRAEGRRLVDEQAALEALANQTDDDVARHGEIEKEITALESDLARAQAAVIAEERRLDRERAFAPIGNAPVEARPRGVGTILSGDVGFDPETGGFRSLGDFAMAVRAQHPQIQLPPDPRLAAWEQYYQAAPTNFHQEGGAVEGYMVPPTQRAEMWTLVFEQENLLNEVDSEPTAGNSVDLTADETTPWGTTGVLAKWRAEATQMTATKLDTEARQVKLHELFVFVLATEELLEDAPRLNSRLTVKSAEALRWKQNEAIINGTGAGQPLGWTKSGALVTVAKEAGQAAATIVAQNVAKMFSRMLAMGITRSFWMVNSDTFPQFATMTLGDQPIWTPPATGFINAPGGVLFGRPVRFNEHMETIGTKNDINLVDPKGYYGTFKTSGVQFAESMHLFFDFNMRAFRWTFRMGGQPHLQAPVSPFKGSNTKSHFITLATRA